MTAHTTNLFYPTWSHIENGCSVLLRQIVKLDPFPELILGLNRGGLIPAVKLSYLAEIPMVAVNYESAHSTKHDHQVNELPSFEANVILIIDDFVKSGHTLDEVYDHYCNDKTVYTACLYYQVGGSYIPNIFWKRIEKDVSSKLEFPWEA